MNCGEGCVCWLKCANMWIAVCDLYKERQSLFQTASLFSTKLLYAGSPTKAFPPKQAYVDKSVFRWLHRQRPRFAVDQTMIEQPKLVLVWMAGGRHWVCWVQCVNMWFAVCELCRERQSLVQTVSLFKANRFTHIFTKNKKISGVLLLVFPRPDAQTPGTWLTACVHSAIVCLNCAGLWLCMVWGFRTVQIQPAGRHGYFRAFQHPWIKDQNPGQKITSKPNTEPPKCHRLAATAKLHNASKSCSRQTNTSTKSMVSRIWPCVGEKENFLQTELDGWKHNEWALASD